LFALLSVLALVGRLRSQLFDHQDLLAAIVCISLALGSHFGWRRAVRRDGARLRKHHRPISSGPART
jgi:hypothetical protein